MAFTLLHRFIDLPYLLTLFKTQQITTLRDLQRALWSFSEE
jgi:hypothetical protein